MSLAPRLTKKQKKALAFRDRGKAKGKSKAESFDELDNDIPVEEDQDRADAALYLAEEATSLEAQAGLPEHATKGGSQVEGESGAQDGQGQGKGKKRKREEWDWEVVKDEGKGEESAALSKKAKKKRKGVDGAAVDGEEDGGEGDARKQKFILFVGNLKYTTTKETVAQHFSQCDPPPTVRLMTPKPSATSKPTAKSKGFAFVEFTHQGALQQGLKLHQSELEGRKINVELTAGGGGNSEHRLEKVKQRNKELHDQRKGQLLKGSSKKKSKGQGVEREGEGGEEVQIDRPQRYSATSGVDQVPLKKRTWSIAEETDEAPAGKKRGSKKGKKRPPKPLGTGVNAIPVG